MKTLFIWFNTDCPVGMSLGVAILTQELLEAGHDAHVIHLNEDLGFPYDEDLIVEACSRFGPDLLALSFGTNHASPARRLARALKHRFPGVPILCGGVHTTLNPQSVFSWDDVDFVAIGEADGVLVDFVDKLAAGVVGDSVPGFWVKRDGRERRNPPPRLPDITHQTFQNMDRIDHRRIIALKGGFADVNMGRGCPYRCAYCHNGAISQVYRSAHTGKGGTGAYVRWRDANDLVDEMKLFIHRFGEVIRAFNFHDDGITWDKRRLRSFRDRYVADVGLPFVCNVHLRKMDEEIVGLMAEAGCNMVKFGVECGSERVQRDILNRPFSPEILSSAVRLFHSRGINARGYVMVGNPTETVDEILKTFELCAKLELDSVRPAFLYPYAGTAIHRLCEATGALDESREMPNYSSGSVLRFDPETALFLRKIAWVSPWLMNACLGNEGSPEYRRLFDLVTRMDGREWDSDRTRRWIGETSKDLHQAFLHRRVPHYFTPLEHRPDAIFLFRDRPRPLINMDTDGSTPPP